MKQIKKITLSIFLLLFALVLTGCKNKQKLIDNAIAKVAITYAENDNEDHVTNNLILPKSSEGYDLVWTSSDKNVISTEGVVTRPLATATDHAYITLSAQIKLGKYETKRDFLLVVLKQDYVAPTKFTITLPETVTANVPNLNEVEKDTNVIFTINPPADKKLVKLTINNTVLTNNVKDNKIQIKVKQNIVVEVEYKDIEYLKMTLPAEVTASVTDLNKILPNTSITLTINVPSEKRLKSFQINTVEKKFELVDNKITFTITKDSNVFAEFVDIRYYSLTLPAEVQANVTDLTKIVEDTKIELTISIPVGKKLSQILINDVNKTTDVHGNKIEFNIIENTTVVVMFDSLKLNVTLEQPSSFEVVTPNIDLTKCPYGTELELKVLIPTDQMINTLLINNKESQVDTDNKFKVTITQDTIINVSFKPLEYIVSFDTDGAKSKSKGIEIFFSEYFEGTKDNKALELYNPTDNPIDLSGYKIRVYSNGNINKFNEESLSGTIAPHQTFLIIKKTCTIPELKNKADLQLEKSLYFNGNDPLVLFKGETEIDWIGKVGEDNDFGVDQVLVRKPHVVVVNSNKKFDKNEWMVLVTDDVSNIKLHTIDEYIDAVIPNQAVPKNGVATTPTIELIKTGYTFAFWVDETNTKFEFTTTVTRNIALKAYFIKNPIVTFDLNGGTATGLDLTVEVITNTTIARPSIIPTMEHFVFDNWYKDNTFTEVFDFTKPITVDTTIYAKYNPKNYNVKFIGDGGVEIIIKQVQYNTTVTADAAPAVVGKTFVNWYASNSFTEVFDFTKPITADTNVYAKYELNTYYVSFFDGSTELTSLKIEIKHGESITNLPSPEKTGYTFDNWYIDEGFANSYVVAPVTESFKLYAKFNINSYKVSFTDATLTCVNSTVSVTSGQDIEFNTILTFTIHYDNTTHRFHQLLINDEETTLTTSNPNDTFNVTLTGETQVTLKVIPTASFILKFNTNGGIKIDDVILTPTDSTVRPVTNPTKYGHTFVNWYTTNTYETEFIFGNVLASDTVVYAKFDVIVNKVKFYDGSTELSALEQNVNYGSMLTEVVGPVKTGYTFAGWYKEEALENLYNFNDKVESSFSLYAKYTINKYDVKFFDGADELISLKKIVDYNTSYGIAPTAPEKEGFDFKGFFKEATFENEFDFTSLITEDTDVYLKYETKVLVIRFFVDDTETVSLKQNVNYGDKASRPDEASNPTKEGHSFAAWTLDGNLYDFENEVVTKDLVLKAKFNPKYNEVTINPNGGMAEIGATDLIISEMGYGAGNNQHFEIYNGTLRTIDLSHYKFKFIKADGTILYTVELTGYLAHDKAIVISNKLNESPSVLASNPIMIDFTGLADACIFRLFKDDTVLDTLGDNYDEYLNGFKDSLFERNPEIRIPQATFDWNEYGYFYYKESDLTPGIHTIVNTFGEVKPFVTYVPYGEKLNLPKYILAGKVITGFQDGEGNVFDINSPITKSLTISVVWADGITITLDLDGGTILGNVTTYYILKGTLFTNPGEPMKELYKFIKWVNKETNEEFNFSVAPTKDITLKAIFKFILEDINNATVDNVMTFLNDPLLELDLTKINDDNRDYLKTNIIAKRPTVGFKTLKELKDTYTLVLKNYTRAKDIDDKVQAVLTNHQIAKTNNNVGEINDELFVQLNESINTNKTFIATSLLGLDLTAISPENMLAYYSKLDVARKEQVKNAVITSDLGDIHKVIEAYLIAFETVKSPEEKINEELSRITLPAEVAQDITETSLVLKGTKYTDVVFTYVSSDTAICSVVDDKLIYVHVDGIDKDVTITVTGTIGSNSVNKEFVIKVLLKADKTESVITRKEKNANSYEGSIVDALNITNNIKNSIEVIYTPATSNHKIFNNSTGIRLYNGDTLKIKVKDTKIYKIEFMLKDAKCEINGKTYNPSKNPITVEFADGVEEITIKGFQEKKKKTTFGEIKISYK